MKRIYTLFIYIALAFSTSYAATSMPADSIAATTVAERLLIGMPYELAPSLSLTNRKELISVHRASPQDSASVHTVLGNDVRMLQCNDNGFILQLSRMSSLQVLPLVNGVDTTICAVTTTSTESVVSIYSSDWNLRSRSQIALSPESFLCDTLTANQRSEALSYIEFPLFAVRSMEMVDGQLVLGVELSVPLLTEEDKSKLKGAFLLRRLNLQEISVNKQ